jgi:hypothetical protein
MAESNVNASRGMGLGSVLFIVFLVLKLCDVITWSWWWVTCPLWAPFIIIPAIFLGIFVIGAIIIFIGTLCGK